MPKRSRVRLTAHQRDVLGRMLGGDALVFSAPLASYGLVGQQFTFAVKKPAADALIERGLIVASDARRGNGSRSNSVYSITDSGRAALKGE